MDTLTRSERSALMSRIQGKNTQPELQVRKALHALGLRFRLHRRDLPGCPDVVLPRHRTVVCVHGCFWHGHSGCRRSALPKVNTEFWARKITRNRGRDEAARKALRRLGWRVIWVWECETRAPRKLKVRLARLFAGAEKRGNGSLT